MTEKILVTGAAGFIGRHLVRQLVSKKYSVVALVRTPEQAKSLNGFGCEIVQVDLLRKDTIIGLSQEITQVFHLAAKADLKTKREKALAVNTQGTSNLLQAIRGFSLKRFVLMSSILAAGRCRGSRLSLPLDASCTEPPDNAYGRSKREAERIVIDEFHGTDTEWVILRPALVYGPGSRPFSGLSTLVDLSKRPGILGRLNFPGRISVIYVNDLIDVCELTAKGIIHGGRSIFVANYEPVTFGQIMITVTDILGQSRTFISLVTFATIVQHVYDGLDAMIGISKWIPAYMLAPFGSSLACDSRDLMKIGYRPRYSLHTGLTQILKT